jgi:hypothetical protein
VDEDSIFSESWELWPNAKEAADQIVFELNNNEYPWSKCLGSVHIGTASMKPSQDFYAPPQQMTTRLWVNGPNCLFEPGLRQSQTTLLGYEFADLMEPDSVPLRRFLLDILRIENEERRSFAVFGSKYSGEKQYD